MSIDDKDKPNIPEVTKTPELQIHKLYIKYKEEELSPVDPNELIKIGTLDKDNPEYQILTKNGVTNEEIKSGKIQRGKLLDAGFAFNNIAGRGEKPIIKGVIGEVDFGKRKLITRDELNQIRQYQIQSSISPDTLNNNDELREDMLSFMVGTPDPRPAHLQSPVTVFRMAISGILENGWMFQQTIPDKKLRGLYQNIVTTQHKLRRDGWEKKLGMSNPYDAEVKYMSQNFSDVYPWSLKDRDYPLTRGLKYQILDSMVGNRSTSLQDSPSPFLDSGFHFGKSYDLTINAKQGFVRMNMMVFHLASRGISEMGDGDRAHDQHYLTMNEYKENIFISNPEDKSRTHDIEEKRFAFSQTFNQNKLNSDVQNRIIELCINEAKQPETSKEVKKLAELIQKRRLELKKPPSFIGKIFKNH